MFQVPVEALLVSDRGQPAGFPFNDDCGRTNRGVGDARDTHHLRFGHGQTEILIMGRMESDVTFPEQSREIPVRHKASERDLPGEPQSRSRFAKLTLAFGFLPK